jgi:hypothetical protein
MPKTQRRTVITAPVFHTLEERASHLADLLTHEPVQPSDRDAIRAILLAHFAEVAQTPAAPEPKPVSAKIKKALGR